MIAVYLLLVTAGIAYGQMCSMPGPIDLDPTLPAFIHAPMEYRNYFSSPTTNKFFNGRLKYDMQTNMLMWYPNAWHMDKVVGNGNWKWKCPSIRRGPFGGLTFTHAYYLYKVQFKWGVVGEPLDGSDHAMDGERSAIEMQMIHVENEFIGDDGKVDMDAAGANPTGLAILSVMFCVDNKKTQNQMPLHTIDNEVWEHQITNPHPHSGRFKRSTEENEELDHEISMRNLDNALKQFTRADGKTKRQAMWSVVVNLNIGAFIRKATRNGGDKTMSTYFTYNGSLNDDVCEAKWVVYQRCLPIAQVQANSFSSLGHNNFRDIMGMPGACDVQHLIHDHIGTAFGPMKG